MKKPDNPVSTTETSFEILEVLHQRDGTTLHQLSEELDPAKSTIHRHLKTLLHREFVVREGNEYKLSLRFLEYGQYARTRSPDFELIHQKVSELAEETNERSHFLVEEHGKAVYLLQEKGDKAIETDAKIGKRIPLHTTAAGKAILASLPEYRTDQLIEQQGLDEMTDYTVTDKEELGSELQEIRERGYSINVQENLEGLRAIGMPVKDGDNKVIGAISVSGPLHRMSGEWFEEELPQLLMSAVNELELNITYA